MILFQTGLREWPPAAVHDTVAAVVSGRAFQRSIQQSLAQRLLRWMADWIDALVDYLRASGPARWVAIGFTVLLVLVVIARFVLAARARSDEMGGDDLHAAVHDTCV